MLICSSFFVTAQNATQSTITFNQSTGLSVNQIKELDAVYHNMYDLNYHCFSLADAKEKSFYSPSKLLGITKARAAIVQNYFINEQNVDPQNVFIQYGGDLPILWLHKTKGNLTASGEINLEDKYRQCYTYNSNLAKTITTEGYNTFYFNANAFVTLDDKAVNSSNINICIWEFTNKKSMVYANLTTHSNDRMLETGGAFYIEAKLNGELLKLKKGEIYTVQMSAEKTLPDMFTYYGNIKDGIVNWEIDKNEPVLVNGNTPTNKNAQLVYLEDEFGDPTILQETWSDNEGDESFYELSAGKLGWVNCDRFYEVKNTSVMAIRVDTQEPIVVRMIFRDINSVLPCYATSNHKDQYQASGIPTGEKVLLLAYSVKGDKAVLGYKEVVIGENKVENITLNNLSKARFEGAVSELLSY
jgi:hypothetical protein